VKEALSRLNNIKEKRDTFCDTHKQAERQRDKKQKKKKAKPEERDAWTKINFIPSGREDKKKHTREHFNCD
jgi:hypothetical protein